MPRFKLVDLDDPSDVYVTFEAQHVEAVPTQVDGEGRMALNAKMKAEDGFTVGQIARASGLGRMMDLVEEGQEDD